MLLPLKKEYVPNFDEWIKFSPTFEDIKEIEEIINAEQPQKEKIWGCQDIEFCGMHFILISQTINDNNILYTYMDESNHLILNATQNDLISVKEKDVFCNSYTTYSQNIYKNDLYYRGKKVFEEHPNKWKHKNALTENEENLIKLVDSLLDEDFIVIFEKISEYRIKIYQSGIIEDIKFPFKKVSKFKDNKRNQFFKKIKDNYNMFPYFKKYCDKVFFYLDNEN